MKTMYKYLSILLVALLAAACVDHVPQVEDLPQEPVSFTYLIEGDYYPLDYYQYSEIKFINTSSVEGIAEWEFGDGLVAEGNEVTHSYSKAGTHYVKLTIVKTTGERVSKVQPLMIAPIKPLMSYSWDTTKTEICEVLTSDVRIVVETPNPEHRAILCTWNFPTGTKWANSEEGTLIEGGVYIDTIAAYDGAVAILPHDLRFGSVGSQTVKLTVTFLDSQNAPIETLGEAKVNVQVGYFEPVPTLYYAVKGGNIKALKLIDNPPAGMEITPFDLGVSSGEHPFNLLFEGETLFLLDPGKQFYYVNDEDGVLGDGKISAIAKDGSKVETVITNVGQAAFDDPFYGYVEDGNLYYANRNTGVVKLPTTTRDKVYNITDFPWYFQHATLNWYNQGIPYGAIGGCFGKVEGAWWWTKFYNAYGIYRFNDSDILLSAVSAGDASNLPFGGVVLLQGMLPKSFAYDKAKGMFYFTIFDAGYNGLHGCTLDQLTAIGASKNATKPYQILHENGSMLEVNTSGNPAAYEGTGSEVVGITQLALDEASSCVYFGYRPDPNNVTAPKAGLMKYDPAVGKVVNLTNPEGADPAATVGYYAGTNEEIYGCVINQTPSKLF